MSYLDALAMEIKIFWTKKGDESFRGCGESCPIAEQPALEAVVDEMNAKYPTLIHWIGFADRGHSYHARIYPHG